MELYSKFFSLYFPGQEWCTIKTVQIYYTFLLPSVFYRIDIICGLLCVHKHGNRNFFVFEITWISFISFTVL
jgi:hypothetical protein